MVNIQLCTRKKHMCSHYILYSRQSALQMLDPFVLYESTVAVKVKQLEEMLKKTLQTRGERYVMLQSEISAHQPRYLSTTIWDISCPPGSLLLHKNIPGRPPPFLCWLYFHSFCCSCAIVCSAARPSERPTRLDLAVLCRSSNLICSFNGYKV